MTLPSTRAWVNRNARDQNRDFCVPVGEVAILIVNLVGANRLAIDGVLRSLVRK